MAMDCALIILMLTLFLFIEYIKYYLLYKI
jgi:hypothetical protein